MTALIPIPVDDPLPMAWLDLNDLGNAERLKRLAKGLLLWVDGVGWAGFDGRRFSAGDGERMAVQLAHEVARHIDKEAVALDAIAEDQAALANAFGDWIGPEIAKARVIDLRKHAVKSGNASMTSAMLTQAKALLAEPLDSFDRDPFAINLANGTLRFVRVPGGSPDIEGGGWGVRFAPHDHRDRFMQVARFVYDPEAGCPEWLARMELVQPERDQRRLLQMLYGYILTGLTSEQKWFIFQGRGGDGKSLTNSVIAKLMGDYHRHADISTFLEGAKKSGSDHSSDMARLQGDIRMVTCEEPARNSTWNATRLKQITGGIVTARAMREAEIEYAPRWKLLIEVNPLPAVGSDDDGFWRRCWPIPWSYQFDKTGGVAAEPFELLQERFVVGEGSGVLNWMIAGALRWLATRRLPQSESATAFALAYRQSASPVGEWYMERCDVSDRAALTPSGELWADFEEWAKAAGLEKYGTQTAFGRWLRDKQHLEKREGKKRFRRGIALKPEAGGSAWSVPPASPSGPAVSNERGGGRGAPQARAWEEDDDDLPA